MADYWGLPVALVFEEFFKDEREQDEQDEAADSETKEKPTT